MFPYLVVAIILVSVLYAAWYSQKKKATEEIVRLRRRAQRYRLALEKRNLAENKRLMQARRSENETTEAETVEVVELISEHDFTLTFSESEALAVVQQELHQQIEKDNEEKRIARIKARERGKSNALIEMHKTRIKELQTTLSQQKSRMRSMASRVETLEKLKAGAKKDKSLAAHRLNFAALLQDRLASQFKEVKILSNKIDLLEADVVSKNSTIGQLQNQLTILARQLNLSSALEEKVKEQSCQLAQQEGELSKYASMTQDLKSARIRLAELGKQLEVSQSKEGQLNSELLTLRSERDAMAEKVVSLQEKIDHQSQLIDNNLQLELRVRQLSSLEKALKLRDARIVELSQSLKATQRNTLTKKSLGRVVSMEPLQEAAK